MILPLLPSDRSIRAKDFVLHQHLAIALDQGLNMLERSRMELFGKKLEESGADQLVTRAAKRPAVGVIDERQRRIGQETDR